MKEVNLSISGIGDRRGTTGNSPKRNHLCLFTFQTFNPDQERRLYMTVNLLDLIFRNFKLGLIPTENTVSAKSGFHLTHALPTTKAPSPSQPLQHHERAARTAISEGKRQRACLVHIAICPNPRGRQPMVQKCLFKSLSLRTPQPF